MGEYGPSVPENETPGTNGEMSNVTEQIRGVGQRLQNLREQRLSQESEDSQ